MLTLAAYSDVPKSETARVNFYCRASRDASWNTDRCYEHCSDGNDERKSAQFHTSGTLGNMPDPRLLSRGGIEDQGYPLSSANLLLDDQHRARVKSDVDPNSVSDQFQGFSK